MMVAGEIHADGEMVNGALMIARILIRKVGGAVIPAGLDVLRLYPLTIHLAADDEAFDVSGDLHAIVVVSMIFAVPRHRQTGISRNSDLIILRIPVIQSNIGPIPVILEENVHQLIAATITSIIIICSKILVTDLINVAVNLTILHFATSTFILHKLMFINKIFTDGISCHTAHSLSLITKVGFVDVISAAIFAISVFDRNRFITLAGTVFIPTVDDNFGILRNRYHIVVFYDSVDGGFAEVLRREAGPTGFNVILNVVNTYILPLPVVLEVDGTALCATVGTDFILEAVKA